jgi:hypothetical protein
LEKFVEVKMNELEYARRQYDREQIQQTQTYQQQY